jgi:predicted TIM-barrel fold metal-dependent hydrolase
MVLPSASFPNIHLKLSGFHYASPPERSWDFPYADERWLYEEAYEAFGSRMVWGSDFPVVKKAMTHKQALEAFRTHCRFVSEED